MGKPEPHCDPRDPLPYQKYFEPFDNLLTTTVAPDNYVVYPSSVSCPDLRPRPCPTDFQLDCPPLSGYEVLLYNNCDVCKEVTFNIKDDVCSRGGLVQQHCCDGARYHTFLVSGDSLTVNLKARTEFRKIYGNFENVQISDPSDCYRYPHVFVNSCTPNHDYILWSDCQTIDIGCSLYKNLVGDIPSPNPIMSGTKYYAGPSGIEYEDIYGAGADIKMVTVSGVIVRIDDCDCHWDGFCYYCDEDTGQCVTGAGFGGTCGGSYLTQEQIDEYCASLGQSSTCPDECTTTTTTTSTSTTSTTSTTTSTSSTTTSTSTTEAPTTTTESPTTTTSTTTSTTSTTTSTTSSTTTSTSTSSTSTTDGPTTTPAPGDDLCPSNQCGCTDHNQTDWNSQSSVFGPLCDEEKSHPFYYSTNHCSWIAEKIVDTGATDCSGGKYVRMYLCHDKDGDGGNSCGGWHHNGICTNCDSATATLGGITNTALCPDGPPLWALTYSHAGDDCCGCESEGCTDQINQYSLLNDTWDDDGHMGNPDYYLTDTVSTTFHGGLNSTYLTWKAGKEAEVTAGSTAVYTLHQKQEYQEDDWDTSTSVTAYRGWVKLVVCSGGKLYDFTDYATTVKDFDVTYYAEMEAYSDDDFTVRHNWAAYEYCEFYNPNYPQNNPRYMTTDCPTTKWHFEIEELRFPPGPQGHPVDIL